MLFDSYSRYYDLLYHDKDYESEVSYVDKLLQYHSIKGTHILEFGSGTGKHGRLLAQRGYQVRGIELSHEMVSRAELTPGFSIEQDDIRYVKINRTFDAVLSLFHVVSYQIDNPSVKDVFSRASDQLLSGGLFIFDVWYSPAVHKHRPSVRVKRLHNEHFRITRIAEPEFFTNENRVDVHYSFFAEDTRNNSVKIFSELHPMRHFSVPELDLFAEQSGFERLSAEAYLTGEVPSEDTWGVCFILRKL